MFGSSRLGCKEYILMEIEREHVMRCEADGVTSQSLLALVIVAIKELKIRTLQCSQNLSIL